jgi:hypothetical protein
MSDDLGHACVALVRSVGRLALPGSLQAEYLRQQESADLADELALDFDDRVRLAPALKRDGWLTDEDVELLDALSARLMAMSGEQNRAAWSAEGLLHDPRWEDVRGLARQFFVKD